ncbi:hypothetical protein TBLA_0C06520 [Henningerozyma blattae CBS 6284]|uniref:Uncharacterized protein n=1 Tax=Henningerozyma blattae (strain ATCC 34711 / CBS 6284 / DSM 70876 / NBRC 10599 / NRRL Y-10934 / UCD 77-7) TaxID=1071380 RepID=I2H243_HENB6|nr:hypothetical protein TBLA_0C06520 [Tetrapisispora blattae CBS 6284]CCH60445.1 hypothetical protein TBLA_0C06520 [Tetrapisispora blattae CBS 6284]
MSNPTEIERSKRIVTMNNFTKLYYVNCIVKEKFGICNTGVTECNLETAKQLKEEILKKYKDKMIVTTIEKPSSKSSVVPKSYVIETEQKFGDNELYIIEDISPPSSKRQKIEDTTVNLEGKTLIYNLSNQSISNSFTSFSPKQDIYEYNYNRALLHNNLIISSDGIENCTSLFPEIQEPPQNEIDIVPIINSLPTSSSLQVSLAETKEQCINNEIITNHDRSSPPLMCPLIGSSSSIDNQ